MTALLLVHTHDETRGLLATRPEHLDRHYAVNVRAALILIQAFATHLTSPDGRIIALTSDHFTPENLAHGATKAALDRVVLAAANELGQRGIRANRAWRSEGGEQMRTEYQKAYESAPKK